jgi:hypothetical protein
MHKRVCIHVAACQVFVHAHNSTDTWWLKAGTVEQEMMADARQKRCKHASTVMNISTVEELLEVVFSMSSMPRPYNENQWGMLFTWVSAHIVRR